ncbi:acetyltransferase GNAT family protein [Lachnospiraceae bacterium KM106-2]|nr:acetyltransferase GNAT family protein [Lachnospiraceae bacterium KM106-2]
MIKGQYLEYGCNLKQIAKIREEVFKEELDIIDQTAIHVLVSEADKYVAAGRVYINDDLFYIDKIAVVAEERHKYYGDFVARMLIDKAFQSGADQIFTYADKDTKKFFMRIGFHLIDESVGCMKITKSDICHQCSK